MKPRIHRFVSGLMMAVVCLSALAACGGSDRSGGTDAQHTIMTWCRVAEFPVNRAGEKIETKGSAATREFDVTFQVQPSDLAQWIAVSPGLKEAVLSTDSDTTIYTVQPKDAASCVIRIKSVTGEVYIKTYWS